MVELRLKTRFRKYFGDQQNFQNRIKNIVKVQVYIFTIKNIKNSLTGKMCFNKLLEFNPCQVHIFF